MIVFRVECSATRHGPHNCYSCHVSHPDRPNYGSILEAPQQDDLLGFTIHKWEVCGTTKEQFNRWWNMEEWDWVQMCNYPRPKTLPLGWVIAIYMVDDEYVRIGRNQTLFVQDKATLIAETRNVDDPFTLVPNSRT